MSAAAAVANAQRHSRPLAEHLSQTLQ